MMLIDQLGEHFHVDRDVLRTQTPMALEALTIARHHGLKVRRVGKCWEIVDPYARDNTVKIADSWLCKGEIERLLKRPN